MFIIYIEVLGNMDIPVDNITVERRKTIDGLINDGFSNDNDKIDNLRKVNDFEAQRILRNYSMPIGNYVSLIQSRRLNVSALNNLGYEHFEPEDISGFNLGDLIIYYRFTGLSQLVPSTAGVLIDNNKVISRWNDENFFEHKIYDIPTCFGSMIQGYKIKEEQ
jgi:hypothetical protein